MTTPPLRRARRSTGFLFFVLGSVMATWAAHIPDVKIHVGLNSAQLGIMLLTMGAGGLAAMMVTGRVVHWLGSGRISRWSAVATAASLPLPLFAPNAWLLAPALFLFGFTQGALDVAMNAQGVAVERAYQRPIMSSLHALFSIGGLAGAGYASLLLSLHVSITLHLVLVLAPLAIGWLFTHARLLPDYGHAEEAAPLFALPRGALLWLGAIAVLSMVGEGAVLDWSALYMRQGLGTGPAFAAAAFAAFSLTMTIGRFMGDGVVARHGDVAVLRGGALIAAVGLGVALVTGSPWAALLGFACVGLGFSNVVPLAFSAAGRVPGVSPGFGIAAVSTVGYGGFFVGPPAIGFVSQYAGLAVGLGLIPLFGVLIAVLAGQMRRSRTMKPASARGR